MHASERGIKVLSKYGLFNWSTWKTSRDADSSLKVVMYGRVEYQDDCPTCELNWIALRHMYVGKYFAVQGISISNIIIRHP